MPFCNHLRGYPRPLGERRVRRGVSPASRQKVVRARVFPDIGDVPGPRARAKLDSRISLVPDFEESIRRIGGASHSYATRPGVVQQNRHAVHDRDAAVPRTLGIDATRDQRWAEAPPVHKILAHQVSKLVRANLVEDVEDALVGENSIHVVDGPDRNVVAWPGRREGAVAEATTAH